MIEEIKELRVSIDGLAQLTKGLKPINESITEWNNPNVKTQRIYVVNSKEIEKAVDSLYLAKAWLGKCMQELGTETPYANDGKRKTVEDIEPAADVAKLNNFVIEKLDSDENVNLQKVSLWNNKNHIEKVDYLRQEIEMLVDQITKLKSQLSDSTFNIFSEKEKAIRAAIASTNTYTHLCEARFWLGWELERIKNSK